MVLGHGWGPRAEVGPVQKARLGALLLLILGVLGFEQEPVSAGPTGNPVIFLHGYVTGAPCPGIGSGQGNGLAAELAERGYTGPWVPVEYYACDSGAPTIQQSGTRGAYFESGKWNNNQGWGEYRGNTNNTDLRHIAYQLAWWTYDNYSSKGQHVSFAGYSMGGLIARWAVFQIAARNPLFPPVLYVDEAVTISAPHRGINDGYNNLSWCPASTQCKQMLPNSSFLKELNSGLGLNPQATGGTDWTAMGSNHCDIMLGAASTDMGDVHKVIYEALKPKCYSHTAYLADRSDVLDMPVRYRHPGQAAWTTTSTGAHSLAWLAGALSGPAL